ncbi:helix-turn-helix domain-containing protein [Sphingomonas cavernae]|uniref:XRE family transcriptional regulator n=1 Tax=Sphingomonas cavernae TaxID=2320861 RepID=A0A418WP49_9SPHN|nr:helix-turn-helix domain-containing protein [Sphingomonas cavernae]RJF93003.1 XRE family transcriptional regulator [Sphingomonas cavernae]
MNIATEIGARLRQEREKRGISQADFGKIGGVSRGSQIAYENDQTSPTVTYLAALDAGGIDVWFVLTGQSAAPANLSEEVVAMLRQYDSLDEIDRAAVRRIVEALQLRGSPHENVAEESVRRSG